MTKNRIPLKVVVRQNKYEDSKSYGKWYGELRKVTTLNTRALCRHISDHGSIFTEDVVMGVLSAVSRCIPELVSQGVGIKIDGLGQFYPTLKTKAAESAEKFTTDHVEGVRLRFLPDSTELDNLTSTEFRKKCAIELDSVCLTTGSTHAGNLAKKYIPFSEYSAETPSQNP
jgi:predicted histone-like DNA-binding protein